MVRRWKRLFVFVVTLLCVTPSFAAKFMNEGANSRGVRYEGTFQNGDTGDLPAIALPSGGFSVSFFAGEGGGGQIEVFASRDNTSANGVSLGTIAATTATSTTFRSVFPYLVINIDAAPASGTARVWIATSALADAGASIAAGGGTGQTEMFSFYIDNTAPNSLATTVCFPKGEHPSPAASQTVQACQANLAALQSSFVSFPVGVPVNAYRITCAFTTGTAPADAIGLGVRWADGAATASYVSAAAVERISFAPGDFATPGFVRSSAVFSDRCPYTNGCRMSVGVTDAGSGAVADVDMSCYVNVEVG